MTEDPLVGGTEYPVQVLVRYLKRFAFARGAEEAQAFEIIAPVEVVRAVAVIVQLDGVVLPEPQPGASGVLPHKLEPERVVLPRVVTGDASPGELAALVEIVRGRVPLTTLGGPIMIGSVAGVAAEQICDILDGMRPSRLLNPEVWPTCQARFERILGFRPEA